MLLELISLMDSTMAIDPQRHILSMPRFGGLGSPEHMPYMLVERRREP